MNQVTAGDYECPRKVLKFLKDLHAAFRMLNLRNDFLRKKFDGKLIILVLLVQSMMMVKVLEDVKKDGFILLGILVLFV